MLEPMLKITNFIYYNNKLLMNNKQIEQSKWFNLFIATKQVRNALKELQNHYLHKDKNEFELWFISQFDLQLENLEKYANNIKENSDTRL